MSDFSYIKYDCIFQSTLPREERQENYAVIRQVFLFQSTLPREERRAPARGKCLNFQFQSTLPREERQSNHASTNMSDDFNPRSHERSDSKTAYKPCTKTISIHAPTRGATCISIWVRHNIS